MKRILLLSIIFVNFLEIKTSNDKETNILLETIQPHNRIDITKKFSPDNIIEDIMSHIYSINRDDTSSFCDVLAAVLTDPLSMAPSFTDILSKAFIKQKSFTSFLLPLTNIIPGVMVGKYLLIDPNNEIKNKTLNFEKELRNIAWNEMSSKDVLLKKIMQIADTTIFQKNSDLTAQNTSLNKKIGWLICSTITNGVNFIVTDNIDLIKYFYLVNSITSSLSALYYIAKKKYSSPFQKLAAQEMSKQEKEFKLRIEKLLELYNFNSNIV